MAKAKDLVDLQDTLYNSKNPTRRWLHCSRRDWIVDAIQRYSNNERTVAAEVGPGSGIYLPVLTTLYQQVQAVDIEEAYLNNARDRMANLPNLTLKTDDITSSQLPDNTFDFILCTEVIEHIKDSQSALKHMWRLLKPGGILLLSTPQKFSPLELSAKIAFLPGIIQIVRYIYQEPVLETGHINLMTESVVRRQLSNAGFNVVENYKTGLYLPLIAEMTGQSGLKFQQSLEKRLRGGLMDWLLWTQYYVCQKPSDGKKFV